MPVVPYIDQSAMPDAPYTAPGVTPVRNAQPEQQQQLGEATQRAGEFEYRTGQTIGIALADQVDEATVKQAVTAFHATANSVLYDPQNGYLHKLGQAAIDGAGPTKQAMAKAQQDGLSGLSNPLQKRMFLQATSPAMLEFGTDIDNHNYAQTAQFAGEAAVGLANAATAGAVRNYASYGQVDADGAPVGDFARYVADAEAETKHAALVMKGAPAGSDVSNAAVLTLHSQIAMGALSQMMFARASSARVQQVYDDMKAKGWLNLEAGDTLGRAVKTYTEQENERANAVKYLSDAYRASHKLPTTSTGTPDYQVPAKGAAVTVQPYNADEGAATLNVPQGSDLQAPADGKVVGVGKDENGTFGVSVQHDDGSITTFSGITASGVKVGDRVQRGEAIATASPTVLWSLADKNGNNVDPTKAGLAAVDLSKVIDEKDLDGALLAMRKDVTDPYQQQQTANEMITSVRRNQQEDNVRKAQNFSDASNFFYPSENWHNIPPDRFNVLTPEQQQQFRDRTTEHVMKQINESEFFKTRSETDQLLNFYANPQMITTDNVEKALPNLSRETGLMLMQRAQELKANPQGVVEADAVNDRIAHFAAPAGIDMHPLLPAGKQVLNDLHYQVDNAINRIKTQNKGKATADQVDEAIKQLVVQRTLAMPRNRFSPLGIFGSETYPKTVYTFQLPAGTVDTAVGSDGRLHYRDASKNDLGVVQ